MNRTRYLPIHIEGWLPQEPNLPSYMQKSNQDQVRRISIKKTATGITLLIIGIAIFSALAMPKSDPTFDNTFVLSPTDTTENFGVGYHCGGGATRIFIGEVYVQGSNVDFKANGTSEQNERLLVDRQIAGEYDFQVPANGDYSFKFEYPNNGQQSTVTFSLKAVWTEPVLVAIAFAVLLVSAPAGTVLVVLGLRGKVSRRAYPTSKMPA